MELLGLRGAGLRGAGGADDRWRSVPLGCAPDIDIDIDIDIDSDSAELGSMPVAAGESRTMGSAEGRVSRDQDHGVGATRPNGATSAAGQSLDATSAVKSARRLE